VFGIAAILAVYLRASGWLIAACALLISYAMLLKCGGDLSPAGNLGAHLDRALFGTHLWRQTWDPEGLLGTLPATLWLVVEVGEPPISASAWLFLTDFLPWAGPLNGSLAYSLANVLLWYLVAEVFYRRRTFFSIQPRNALQSVRQCSLESQHTVCTRENHSRIVSQHR
jgi:predicted acyltransferase